jgi:hypothetical protein
MVNGDGVIFRDLVQVMNGELPAIFHFGIVKEIALNPIVRRRLRGSGTQLLDNTVNRDHLDFERIADKNFVEQRCSACVVVCFNEAGDDSGALGVPSGRARPYEVADVGAGADGEKAAVLDCERLCTGLPGSTVMTRALRTTSSGALVEEFLCSCASKGPISPAPVRANRSRRVVRLRIVLEPRRRKSSTIAEIASELGTGNAVFCANPPGPVSANKSELCRQRAQKRFRKIDPVNPDNATSPMHATVGIMLRQ